MKLFDGFGNFVGDLDVAEPDIAGPVGCIFMLAVYLTFLPIVGVYYLIMKGLGNEHPEWYEKLLVGLISVPIGAAFWVLFLGILVSCGAAASA